MARNHSDRQMLGRSLGHNSDFPMASLRLEFDTSIPEYFIT